MPPSYKGKNGNTDKDKIPIASLQQLLEELKAFKTALLIKETEHTWEALDRAVKRFTAVTRGGGYRYESEYIAGLKDRELAKAVVGARTQLSASTLLFLSAATRLGQAFAPLLFLYFPHIIRLLSRTNKLYISRATACLAVIIGNTRLAGVIPYLREGMLEKSATHRKGCIAGILHALGGPDPLTPISSASTYEGLLVDKEIVRKRYLEDVETCIRIGARDKDIEVRQIAKRCWEIYRSEFSERVASFAGPLTPIARRYLELPPMGQPIPDYAQSSTASLISRPSKTTTHPPEGANAGPSHPTARPHALPAAPRGPPPTKPIANQNPTIHTVHRAPGRMMPANPTEGPASVLSQAAKGTLPSSSSSLSTSQGPSRPPPTLFARRVLPPSSAISMGSRANEARLLSSTGSLTTFPRDHPLASTSHGSPATVLPKNISLDAPNHSNQAWSTHQPPLILPADNHTSAPAQASQSESSQRPALACSLSSGVASTSTSPSKEPFRPTSSAPSRFHDRDDDPIRHAPISSTLNQPGAPIHAAKVEPPQQRRVVPAQVHRAPTRATRRASRVLPPSTDFQDFLSSTAAAAASESQWPVPSAPTASATGLAEIPTKRSASAMSTASLSSSTVAVFPMERSVSPTGTHPTQIQPVKDALPEATDTSQSLVNTSSTDSTTRENCVPQEEDVIILSQSDVADSARSAIATGFTLQTTTQMLPADSASSSHGTDICLTPQIIPPMRTSQPSGASQASLSPQIVSTSLVVADKLGDGLQGGIHRESGSESERKAAHAEVQASEVPDTATTTDEEVNLANKPYSDIMGSSAASKDLPHSVDIAALAANLPLAKREITGETSRPPLAGARQKTAFRPQKPHKSTEELAWMPLPALIADKVYSNAEPSGSVLSSSSAKHDSTVTAASAHNEDKPSVSEQQNLKSSLNLGRPPARAEQAPRQAQIRSVSTTSTSAQPPAGGAVLLRSSHPVRAVRPRQPIIPAPRQVQVSEKVKPPPTKKQILSFSTGSRVERPVYGGGAARSVNPSTRPAVSANSSRLPASNASSTARQGSIFSRLTAPTAASAGKAKPRIPSESKETFKKPLLSSRPPVKKASTVSLKSSQGSQDRLARVLKDETNTANIARTQSSAPTSANVDKALNQQEKLAQIENTQALATSTASLDPSATDPGITAEAASVHSAADSNLQSRNNNADTDSDTTATSSLAESYRKSQESTALPVLPTPSLKVKHDEYSVLQAATSIPLPSSPSTFAVVVQPHKSNSILAELGIIDAGASQTTNVPSPTRSLVDNKSFSRESHSNSSGAAVSDSVARIDQANAHKDKEAPELEQIQAVSPNSEATVQEIGSKRSVQTEMLDDNAESFASADATVILHNLEELGLDSTANTDPAIGQIEAPEATDRILDYLTSASQQSDSSKDIAPVSASSTPIKAPAQSTTNASLPKLSPEQPPTERSQSPKPEDVPLPHDVTAAFDASLSILASPIRGMRELLARSTGPQALEERSPLLLEKEYLPENAAGQYEYDDTVLDMYCTTSEMRGAHLGPETQSGSIAPTNSRTESSAVDNIEATPYEDEEEDEIALLISRELSSDSLEELASRWEESRVISSLGLLDESSDGFDSENTPMRPRLLTRLSDGESSDYGSAPAGTATYSKDDEDAALDILLNLGQQGDKAGWHDNDALLTESLLMLPGKVLPMRKTGAEDRGILAEMSGYADTPRVSRQAQQSGKEHASIDSILGEGGLA